MTGTSTRQDAGRPGALLQFGEIYSVMYEGELAEDGTVTFNGWSCFVSPDSAAVFVSGRERWEVMVRTDTVEVLEEGGEPPEEFMTGRLELLNRAPRPKPS